MRQFILPDDWDGGTRCLVEGGSARYVTRVLRLGPGDSFPGLDSSGRRWTCRVLESEGSRLLLSIASPPEGSDAAYLPDVRAGGAGAVDAGGAADDVSAAFPGPPGFPDEEAASLPRIILIQGLLKGPKMDLVVRQAAEAGVSAIVPLIASRSIAQSEGGASRRIRWERIVKEAMQQSGSTARTEVLQPIQPPGLSAVLDSLGLGPGRPRILLHESPLAQSSMHGYLTGTPDAIALCVGPEGGFSRDEVDLFLGEGFAPLRFAGAILRAETASLYAVAAARIILSERSSWIPKPL
jgi:16S rRNA (uracil1498-N3)-methyltransferase